MPTGFQGACATFDGPLYGAGCLIAAAVAGLGTVLAIWLAALVVGGVLLICAAFALSLASARSPAPPC